METPYHDTEDAQQPAQSHTDVPIGQIPASEFRRYLPTTPETIRPDPDPLDTLAERNLDNVSLNTRGTWSEIGFLVSLHRHHGNISNACWAIGIRPRMVKAKMQKDPKFKAIVERERALAREALADLIDDRNITMALKGVKRVNYAADGTLLSEQIADDPKATQWLAERLRPAENHLPTVHEHTGKDGAAIRFKFEMGETADTIEGEIEDAEIDELDDGAWDTFDNDFDDAA